MCETIVQWATILSPIVAVFLAWWTVRSSSKDTDKKIAAIDKSTTKQIESIKELESLQAEIATIQIEKELWEINNRWLQNYKQIGDALENQHSFITQYSDVAHSKTQESKKTEKNLEYEQDFYVRQIKCLESYLKRVKELKKKLELE